MHIVGEKLGWGLVPLFPPAVTIKAFVRQCWKRRHYKKKCRYKSKSNQFCQSAEHNYPLFQNIPKESHYNNEKNNQPSKGYNERGFSPAFEGASQKWDKQPDYSGSRQYHNPEQLALYKPNMGRQNFKSLEGKDKIPFRPDDWRRRRKRVCLLTQWPMNGADSIRQEYSQDGEYIKHYEPDQNVL